jgi:pyrimidine operon attenuation protein/uracil phosphoribosyltransferase
MIKNEILDHKQVQHKIRRIAFQIAEVYLKHDPIILAGIAEGGYTFAKELKKVLSTIITTEIKLCKVTINKIDPLQPVTTSLKKQEYKNCGVVLCDDVLNSGTTLIYAVKHFLNVPLD